MSSLAQRLMSHLATGLPMIKIGGGFQINDCTNWAMSDQKLDGRPTGKVALVCDDTDALAEFTQLATAAGHTVEPAGPLNTVLITPKSN